MKKRICLHDFENGEEIKAYRKYGYCDEVGHEVKVMRCCKCKKTKIIKHEPN